MRLNHVYILVGSNENPQRNIPLALGTLQQWFNIVAVSPIYESAAVGGSADEPPYWNVAIQIETYTILLLLLRKLRAIEHHLGRRRFDLEGERLKIVTVDLDLLLYNNEVNRSALEPLPHPDLLDHAYAAVPLADLAPHLPHPVTGELMSEIANRLRPTASLRRLESAVRIDVDTAAQMALLTEGEADEMSDTVMPSDIPEMLNQHSAAPSLESLVRQTDSAFDVQPSVLPVEMPVPAPEKKKKGKKASTSESAADVSLPPKPRGRRKKDV